MSGTLCSFFFFFFPGVCCTPRRKMRKQKRKKRKRRGPRQVSGPCYQIGLTLCGSVLLGDLMMASPPARSFPHRRFLLHQRAASEVQKKAITSGPWCLPFFSRLPLIWASSHRLFDADRKLPEKLEMATGVISIFSSFDWLIFSCRITFFATWLPSHGSAKGPAACPRSDAPR